MNIQIPSLLSLAAVFTFLLPLISANGSFSVYNSCSYTVCVTQAGIGTSYTLAAGQRTPSVLYGPSTGAAEWHMAFSCSNPSSYITFRYYVDHTSYLHFGVANYQPSQNVGGFNVLAYPQCMGISCSAGASSCTGVGQCPPQTTTLQFLTC